MRLLARCVAALAVASLVACSTNPEDDAGSDEAAVTTGAVTGNILHDLMITHPSQKGRTWSVTTGNALTGGWLMQVPNEASWGRSSLAAPIPCRSSGDCEEDFGLATCASDGDCGGGACVALEATKKSDRDEARKVCAGHSDALLDEIYGVAANARSSLDVTSLSAPTGRFLATLRNALTTLDRRNKPVVARFLFGSFPGSVPDLNKILADLTRDMSGSAVSVSVGVYKRSPISWNHSKIIAADGAEAIVGGMNLWSDHYLDADPVHDVSLHHRGPIAAAAQIYVNELWDNPCRSSGSIQGRNSDACPPKFVAPPVRSVGHVQMIAVGRTGSAFENPSDKALVAMMDAARSTIRISQQDIGSVKLPGGVLPDEYLDAWTRAARRGVDVTVVVSNDGAFGGKGHDKADSYFNDWSLADLWNGLSARQKKLWPDAESAICKHVHFARLRSSTAATWADGRPQANHAKVVVVDDQAHYVGSQNLYEANLAEFGVIVDNQPATQQFLARYSTKLFEHSKSTLYVDPSCR